MSQFRTLTTAALLALTLVGASVAHADDFGPTTTDTTDNTATAPVGSDTAGGVGHVSAQTNIDSTKTISVNSSVQVNTIINGQNIAYGLNAPNVLNDMNDNASTAAQFSQQQKSNAQTVADFAMAVAGLH